jgi:transcription-repair coupling factor (superfamily II helicase)
LALESLLLSPGQSLPAAGNSVAFGRLVGASAALAISELAQRAAAPLLVLAEDPRHADLLEAELRFFAAGVTPVQHFVEWETLPWDSFSPHQDIISERLAVLASLKARRDGITVVSAPALLQRLPPTDYVAARSLSLKSGQSLPREPFIDSLAASGYLRVPQVSEHGEFAVRGSLIDVYPMGSAQPVRIDFFDDEIESLRYFGADTQLSGDVLEQVNLLPAREVPLDPDSIQFFRAAYRERFEGQPGKSRVYREISDGIAHGGIEYYLPLFFPATASLLDYLPGNCLIVAPDGLGAILQQSWSEIEERYELSRLDPERPILSATETFATPQAVLESLQRLPQVKYSTQTLGDAKDVSNLPTQMPPALKIEARYEDAAAALMRFLDGFAGRVLFCCDSAGRREQVFELLTGRHVDLARVDSWQSFRAGSNRIGVAIAPVENGVLLPAAHVAIIGEQQLFGERARRRNRQRRIERDPETIIRQLNDLAAGSPVVHAEYGVGRYLGLTTLEAGGIVGEFLQLEYADGDKLYVPVHALDLITRFTGTSPENAPLHRLGSDQWAKAQRRAIKKIRDVAAELLDVYARRAARGGHRFHWPEPDYRAFEAGFPFDLTEDQERTINEVLDDLRTAKPMDRVVCGDVGFGKTEVALRATFAAVHGGKQVAILVPTTLLAQQHGQTFSDRFADWPVRVGQVFQHHHFGPAMGVDPNRSHPVTW